MVEGGGCARLESLRRVGRGGENCARLEQLRRVGGDGGAGGSSKICSRDGDNNVSDNIVNKVTETGKIALCSPTFKTDLVASCGGAGGSHKIFSRGGDTNDSANIVSKVTGTSFFNLCSPVLEFDLVASDGSTGGFNKICNRGGDNNVSNKIAIKMVGTALINLCSPALETDLTTSVNARWISNLLFPRKIPRFKHLSSFTRKTDIARKGMVEGCLVDNKSTLLPVIGIIVME